MNIEEKLILQVLQKMYFYLNKSNFYIHPSYREGMPKSLIEAMSVGLFLLPQK